MKTTGTNGTKGLVIALVIIAVIAILFGTLLIIVVKKNYVFIDKDDLNTTNSSEEVTYPNQLMVNIPNESGNIISEGLDYPMETWLLVKKRSLLSADAAIWDGDNNNLKTPIYDNEEATVDMIFFQEDVYIWLEWGGHLIENATDADIIVLINNKIASGYTVRYFSNFTKLGEHSFTTCNSKITE